MKSFITTCFAVFSGAIIFAQEESLFYDCLFEQLNTSQYKLKSYFAADGGNCFETQTRYEWISNDTVYLKTLYHYPVGMTAFGCSRRDTLERTIFTPEIHYVNVSAGIIYYTSWEPIDTDTIWTKFDSTFAAPLGLSTAITPTFNWSCNNHTLTVNGKLPVDRMEILTSEGKTVQFVAGNQTDVSALATGIYLLRIFAGTNVHTMRWYRE